MKINARNMGRKPCRLNVYRDIFCNEYNLSFHKPKKDQCLLCNVYNEKKLRGETTEQDEKEYSDHQASKQSSRNEQTKGKARAKTDKTFVAATFDLEAVLPTPRSNVGDVYYKRCLSTYNLSFYSLRNQKGTRYIWDETNSGRGASDIGSCILLSINSIAEKNPNMKEITFYSDTCGDKIEISLLRLPSFLPYTIMMELKQSTTYFLKEVIPKWNRIPYTQLQNVQRKTPKFAIPPIEILLYLWQGREPHILSYH
jgi:hypothetical protein